MGHAVTADEYRQGRVAAGILDAAGWLPDSERLDVLDDSELLRRLDRVINNSTLWLPGEAVLSPPPVGRPRAVADWIEPRMLADHEAARLGSLLNQLVAERVERSSVPSTGLYASLRLRARTADDARSVANVEFEVDAAPSVTTVVGIEADTRPMLWGWPLDVVLIGGPDDWLRSLQGSSHHPYIYEVRRFGDTAPNPAHGGSPEIVVVDGTINPDYLPRFLDATCLIITGDIEPTEDLLIAYVSRFGAAVTMLIPDHPSAWWSRFFHELCHDNPADVAASLAAPDALAAVPSSGLEPTASGFWLVTAGLNHPELADLAEQLEPLDYIREDLATNETRTVSGTIRPRPVVEVGHPEPRAEAAAGPETDPPPPATGAGAAVAGAAVAAAGAAGAAGAGAAALTGSDDEESPADPAKRHLVANVIDGDNNIVRSALPPESDLGLVVKIAVPSEGDTYDRSTPFSEPERDQGAVKLMVTVRSDVWSDAQTQEISLKTASHQLQAPSSLALFEFTTQTSGSVVLFDITISHKGRTLQGATLEAVVRNRSLPGETPDLTVNRLSGPNEPSPDASEVDLHLDLRKGLVQDRNGKTLVGNLDLEAYLDLYDRDFSKVLGQPDAPSSWSDDDGRALLIKMANYGALFRTQFSTVKNLAKAQSIELRVLPQSKTLPIELIYLGPAPDDNAKLCRHVKRPTKKPKLCSRASNRIVCPYAFLGLNAVVSRVIEGEPKDTSVRHNETRLAAGPSHILYAATHRADVGADAPVPSDQVEATARELFDSIDRVDEWEAWRTAVTRIGDEPRMLVLLGHTQLIGNRVQLHIGRNSWVNQAQIDKKYTGIDESSTRSPLVVLMACSSGVTTTGPFHGLPASFVLNGAGSVVATLSKINGPHAAEAIEAFLRAVTEVRAEQGRVSDAITRTRRALAKQGLPAALVVVASGDIDLKLT